MFGFMMNGSWVSWAQLVGSLRRIGQLVFSSRLLFVCVSVEGQKTATHLCWTAYQMWWFGFLWRLYLNFYYLKIAIVKMIFSLRLKLLPVARYKTWPLETFQKLSLGGSCCWVLLALVVLVYLYCLCSRVGYAGNPIRYKLQTNWAHSLCLVYGKHQTTNSCPCGKVPAAGCSSAKDKERFNLPMVGFNTYMGLQNHYIVTYIYI